MVVGQIAIPQGDMLHIARILIGEGRRCGWRTSRLRTLRVAGQARHDDRRENSPPRWCRVLPPRWPTPEAPTAPGCRRVPLLSALAHSEPSPYCST